MKRSVRDSDMVTNAPNLDLKPSLLTLVNWQLAPKFMDVVPFMNWDNRSLKAAEYGCPRLGEDRLYVRTYFIGTALARYWAEEFLRECGVNANRSHARRTRIATGLRSN